MIQPMNGHHHCTFMLLFMFFIRLFRYDIADMNLFRSALSACMVEGLNHTKRFLYSNDHATKQSAVTNTAIPLKMNNNNLAAHGIASAPLSVRLPPISLAGLNQSLRNFTHGRLS